VLEAQKLPRPSITPRIWKERFEDINAFEHHLWRNGTIVRKFYLHISRREQRRRLLARLDNPEKHWKFSMADLAERALWKAYRDAYTDMLAATSQDHAPWYIIPADHKWFAQALVADIVVDALRGLDLSLPEPDAARRRDLANARRQLLRGE
jgi:polyphosphate kinase 2 (PPK2 family)